MKVEILGIDHIYISVSNLNSSEVFYDQVMSLLGFRQGTLPINSEPHRHYYNRYFNYTIRLAKVTSAHNPYAPELHHLCFRVEDCATVDAVAKALIQLGIEVSCRNFIQSMPLIITLSFFADPDGIRLEVTNFRQKRRQYENWNN